MNDDDSCACNRCCPYGPLLSVASILATVASVLTWIASIQCNFYESDGLGIGLWTVQDPFFNAFFTGDFFTDDFFTDDFFTDDFSVKSSDSSCFSWNARSGMKELLDPPMQFARVLSAVASFSSGVVFIFILLPACVTLPRMFMKSLAIYMFFLSFILMLCLVALASDICTNANDCSIDTAGILCIVASFLWAGAGAATINLQRRPEPSVNSPGATAIPFTPTASTVTTKTLGPDGTLTTTHTTTTANPDGSKTVSETTEVTPSTSPDGSEITEVTAGVTKNGS